MRLQGREVTPTRASQLALKDEEKLIREGYEFLDEKRVLLAQELLRQVNAFKDLNMRRQHAHKDAAAALVAASMRHGLEELSVYPPPVPALVAPTVTARNFLGLQLLEADLDVNPAEEKNVKDSPSAVFPSLEAVDCAVAFRNLLAVEAARAAVSTNLYRLAREYVTTERRARALENVLLPEIATAVKQIGEHLEASDQEESLRVRHLKAVRDR